MDPINSTATTSNPNFSQKISVTRSIVILIITILVVAISAGVFWISTFPSGQILLNKYFPTPKRTVSLIQSSAQAIKSYDFDGIETFGTSTSNTINGFVAKNGNKQFVLSYKNKTTVSSSNLLATIVAVNGKTYGQDLFDGSWHVTDDGVENRLPVAEVMSIKPDTLTNQLCSKEMDPSQIVITDSAITVTCKISTASADPFKSVNAITFVADRSTYNITSVSVSATTKEYGPLAIELHFKNYDTEDRIVTAPTSLNPFGDFLSREALVINSNQGKSFDYLWNAWEKANFDCTKCVNPMADTDNDGVLNALEFLFGTDSKKNHSNNQALNDLEALKSAVHPVTGQPIPELFASSTLLYLKNYTFASIKKTTVTGAFDPYTLRQTVASVPVTFKSGAKVLTLAYLSNLPAGNYVTVFIGNDLTNVIEIDGTGKSDWVNIPVSNYIGTTTNVTVVLNPYSKLEYNFKENGVFTVDFPNIHINPYDQVHPFYVDATSASLKSLSGPINTTKPADTNWKIGTNRVLEWYGPSDTDYGITIIDLTNQKPIGSLGVTQGAETGDKQHGYAWVVGSYHTFVGGTEKTLSPGKYQLVASYVADSQERDIPIATVTIY